LQHTTKNMEKNSLSKMVDISELLKCDSTLVSTKVKTSSFAVELIAIANSPCSNSLHFIKSEYFWKIFFEKAESQKLQNLLVVVDKTLENHALNYDKIQTCLVSPNVELSMAKISRVLFEKKYSDINEVLDGRIAANASIHPTALVSPLAFIGEHVVIKENVTIHPGAHVGAHCEIGAGTTVFPKVCLYPFVTIGRDCRIHAGTVIGSDGFGYVFDKGIHVKIWHIGGVKIGNHVEIGSNSCVDSGTFIPTQIGDHCIIDNQVQIAHNTQLGKGVVLCGQVGTGGSSKIGDYVVFGGRAALAPQCEVGNYSKVAGGGMVTKNWGESIELAGHPARPLKEWLKSLALVNRLDKTK
jgi:UDP-3-O-[3-hydroxymyristoyl] glucosamine N-acyltransferase